MSIEHYLSSIKDNDIEVFDMIRKGAKDKLFYREESPSKIGKSLYHKYTKGATNTHHYKIQMPTRRIPSNLRSMAEIERIKSNTISISKLKIRNNSGAEPSFLRRKATLKPLNTTRNEIINQLLGKLIMQRRIAFSLM